MTGGNGMRVSVAALAVAVTALAVFALALGNGFAYDDVTVVLGDARLRAPLDLRAIFTGGYWQSSELALYRPLTTLSLALDWVLAPASPAWFHLTNVLLHAGASVLLFLLLARLFPVVAALVGGLVFAVHPVHVEAIANVVGRAELLAAVFTFGACLVWGGEGRYRLPLVAALSGAALLSKESAIMLPALLVLLDAAAGRRFLDGIGSWVRRLGPQLAVLVGVAAAYLGLRAAVLGGLTPGQVDPVLEVAAAPGGRVLTALQAWPAFLRLLFFPVTLLADYGPRILLPAESWTPAAAAGLVLLLGSVAGGLVALAGGARRTALGLLWVPVTTLPISNLLVPIGVLVAERTLYVPSFAVSVAAAGAAVLVATRVPQPARRLSTIAAAIILALLAGRSMVRIPDWKDTEAIMAAQLRDRPDSFRGYWFAARFMQGDGDPVAAGAAYDRAVALWPHRKALVTEAAAHAVEHGQAERAVRLIGLLTDQWPEDVWGYTMLAGIALDARDLAVAERALAEGLRRAPLDPMLRRMAAALDSVRADTQ